MPVHHSAKHDATVRTGPRVTAAFQPGRIGPLGEENMLFECGKKGLCGGRVKFLQGRDVGSSLVSKPLAGGRVGSS